MNQPPEGLPGAKLSWNLENQKRVDVTDNSELVPLSLAFSEARSKSLEGNIRSVAKLFNESHTSLTAHPHIKIYSVRYFNKNTVRKSRKYLIFDKDMNLNNLTKKVKI